MGTSGIDWPAWVQAVGSVAAIIGAVIIDRGSARRAREARAAAESQAVLVRYTAILRCAEAFERSKHRMLGMNPDNVEGPRANILDGVNDALAVLDFYIDRSGEIDPDLIKALFTARAMFKQALNYINADGGAYDEANRTANLSALVVAAEHGRKALADYDEAARQTRQYAGN